MTGPNDRDPTVRLKKIITDTVDWERGYAVVSLGIMVGLLGHTNT